MQMNLWGQTPLEPEEISTLIRENELGKRIVTSKMHGIKKGPSPLTEQEVEKIRLLLSVYQDGSGMLALANGLSKPGWRDFERAVAAALGGRPPKGEGQEGKNIFDVAVPIAAGLYKGISCKMRRELNRVLNRDHRVSLELSNSAQQFWDYLEKRGIDHSNYKERPAEVGIALIELVTSWHYAESSLNGGNIDLDESSYLVLSWNRGGDYQLHQFPIYLPDPTSLIWDFPYVDRNRNKKRGRKLKSITEDEEQEGRRIRGLDASGGTLFEWYGESGGQLKYFPLAETAIWSSPIFRLEPLPLPPSEYGLLAKVKQYFPKQWQAI